jgi:hypothetical protein
MRMRACNEPASRKPWAGWDANASCRIAESAWQPTACYVSGKKVNALMQKTSAVATNATGGVSKVSERSLKERLRPLSQPKSSKSLPFWDARKA